MLYGQVRTASVVIAAMLLFAATLGAQQPNPSKRCKYQPDPDPAQIGPGNKNDDPYDFAYVSDYNTNDQKYRRRICDDSTTAEKKVRFDWPITGLKGRCPSGGTLSEETPCAPTPDSGDGELTYDLRSTKTTAYKLSSCKAPSGALVSSLTGYVAIGIDLIPVDLMFTSRHTWSEFSYGIVNKSSTPIKVYWKEFADFWKQRDPKQYSEVFARLVKEGQISGSPDTRTITVNEGREANWTLIFKDAEAKGQYAKVEIYGPEAPESSKEPDLAGVVALYLPLAKSDTVASK